MKFTSGRRRAAAAVAAVFLTGESFQSVAALTESSMDKSGMARIRRHHQLETNDARSLLKKDLIGGLGTVAQGAGTVITGVGQAIGLNNGVSSGESTSLLHSPSLLSTMILMSADTRALIISLYTGSSSSPAPASSSPAAASAPASGTSGGTSSGASSAAGSSAAAPASNNGASSVAASSPAAGVAAPASAGSVAAAADPAVAVSSAAAAASVAGVSTVITTSATPVILPDGTTSTSLVVVSSLVTSTSIASSAAVGIVAVSNAIPTPSTSLGTALPTGNSSSLPASTGAASLSSLLNGLGGAAATSTYGGSSSDLTSNDGNGSSTTTKIIVPIVAVVGALALVAFIVILMRRRRRLNDRRMQPSDYMIPETVGLNAGPATGSGFPAMGGGAALAGAVMRSSGSSYGATGRADRTKSGESWMAGAPMSPLSDEDGYSYEGEPHEGQQASEHSHLDAGIPTAEDAEDMYTPYPAEAAVTTPPALQPGHPNYGAAGAGVFLSNSSNGSHGGEDVDRQRHRQSVYTSEEDGAGAGGRYATASEESYDGSATYGYSNQATRGLDQAGAPGISSPYKDLHRPVSTSANTAYGGYAATEVGADETEHLQGKRQSTAARSEHSAAPSVVGNQYDGADVGEDPFTYVVADQSSNPVMQNPHLNSSRWSG